jgi:peptide-methionine (S)-S-oxide reductase
MIRSAVVASGAVLLAVCALAIPLMPGQAEDAARSLPTPAVDLRPVGSAPQTAVFAGGCFWGIQGVFEHVKGVTQAFSGYAGGNVANPSYEQVSSGTTGHAESVKVTFDPTQVSYGTLLRIFFSVGLDPTQKDQQGPDRGTQYRSELFVNGPDQERVAKTYIAQLEAAHVYSRPIATRVDQAGPFYPAEGYHQDYLDLHPDQPYIVIYDLPKVQALRMQFPDNWNSSATKVAKLASGN